MRFLSKQTAGQGLVDRRRPGHCGGGLFLDRGAIRLSLFLPALLFLTFCALLPPVRAESARAESTDAGERPVPEPATGHFDDAIRRQLEEEHDRLEIALERGMSGRDLAEAYGRLGEVYFIYDLLRPAEICFLNARDAFTEDPRWLYFLAIIHERGGDLEASVVELEGVLARSPSNPAASVRLADALLELGRFPEAERLYREILGANEASASALYGLGRIASTSERYEEAVRFFDQALELEPSATAIHHHLGLAYRALGKLEKARSHFEMNSGGRIKLADPLVQEVFGLVKSPRMFVRFGVEAAQAGKFSDAIGHFKRAVDADPGNAEAFYHLALTELQDGRRYDARIHLGRAIELEPEFRDFRLALGKLLADEGRSVEAEIQFRRAHEIDPQDPDTRLDWAASLSRLGRTDEASAEVAEVLERDAGDPRAGLTLGLLNAAADPAAASIAFRRVTQSSRADVNQKAQAHYHLATLSERAGDDASAEAAYREALALEPETPEYFESLALFLGRQARFVEAAEAYRGAIAADGTRVSAHFGRAMALLLGERYSEARAGLEESTSRLPQDVAMAHLLARVLVAAPSSAVRDGQRGHEIALRVYRASPSQDHGQTLAMAFAELGRFEEAVQRQREALAELERSGERRGLAVAQRRLGAYLRREPCRAPWLESGG